MTWKKLLFICLFLSLMISCSGSGPSDSEQQALQSSAFFQPGDVHSQVGGVYDASDALPASQPFHTNTLQEALAVPVQDCTLPGLAEKEKLQALQAALEDTTGQTIPVKFAFSFGGMHDVLAKAANERAVLSESHPGWSYIPVGGKNSKKHGSYHAYYQADTTKVRADYSSGKKCFYSTVTVDASKLVESKDYYDFIQVTDQDAHDNSHLLRGRKDLSSKNSRLRQLIHSMYYGFCKKGKCQKNRSYAGEYANRLFDEVPSMDEGQPQIIKLYMADLRSEQIKHDIVKLRQNTVRGVALEEGIENILNVCRIHENYHDVTKNLRLGEEVDGYYFEPIHGAVQLVENFLSHDVDGTILPSQYTPIVIDLDGDGVRTSSVRWGTYFNMAALDNKNQEGQSHRTAWLGGHYEDLNSILGDHRVTQDVRLVNTDGFLVLVDENNQVTSSTQMFGDHMTVGGKTYENGFLALQAFAGKNCAGESVKDRYVSLWDGDIYENQLKLWVDHNRNGRSDQGEILGLREAGVIAINACNIVHQDEEDAFGNGTHLRSAALMSNNGEAPLDTEAEVEHHLLYGRGTDGVTSRFHLAIDLIFEVKEEQVCPGPLIAREDYPLGDTTTEGPIGIPSNAPPVGIPSTEPVPVVDPTDEASGGVRISQVNQ